MKPVSRDWDEFCYPFIYADNPACDFEIAADDLCCRIGLLLTLDIQPLTNDILQRLQPNVYHLNGSVRGKLAIDEYQLSELKADYRKLRDLLDGGFKGFVLPFRQSSTFLGVRRKKSFVRWLLSSITENVRPLLS
jgi:hypothetical protein